MTQMPLENADPRSTATDAPAAGTDPDVNTHCAICGDHLVDGYTVRVSLDHPDDLDIEVHQFCCLAHAATWIETARRDPAYADR